MRKTMKRFWAFALALSLICTTFLGYATPTQVFAAEASNATAHLKSGSGNGNSHFGNGTPEAFVLSDKSDITNESFSFNLKLGSTKDDTRLRIVTKYVDDSHWGYIAYDGTGNHWFIEYQNDGTAYPNINGLPVINQNDEVTISGAYTDAGLVVNVVNKTTNESGEATITNSKFLGLKDQAGKFGFGAATYNTQYTDVYFTNVKIGDTQYASYNEWSVYKDALEGQVWEASAGKSEETPTVEPTVEPTVTPEPTPVVTEEGKKWFKITGGANNAGGHAYGNAGAKAPILLLDNDKKMEDAGALSLSIKPSVNWGVFYSYVDDKNWLYIGYDNSSKWYYQYCVNGSGSYPGLGGLPTPVEGEELQMTVSLSRETLSVTVNGTTVRVTNQDLIKYAEATAGKGRFGVKTNAATSISFADVTYNGINAMDDQWVFCAERAGQLVEELYSKMVPFTGTIVDAAGKPVENAVVRVGVNSTKTDATGHFQFDALELGKYNLAVTCPGYLAYSDTVTIEDKDNNTVNVTLEQKAPLDLTKYDSIQSDAMKVYIGKEFPVVSRYQILENGNEVEGTYFRGNETELNTVAINGTPIVPSVTVAETTTDSRTYAMHVQDDDMNINLDMKVKVSVNDNDLTWEVTELTKAEGCAKIATIDVPQLNLLTVDEVDKNANFAGAKTSTTTTVSGDVFLDFENGFVPSKSEGYLYGFLSTDKLSAGLYSNSEAEGDKRVILNNGADTMGLTSAPWYYELGDKNGQKKAANYDDYPVSELPCAKVSISGDVNEDGEIDWNDGALGYRDIMHIAYGSEEVKDIVNYRIVMNFASMASNPYMTTADNIKKVYLATDGLQQAVLLKGYGNEGHDSANSEYADIAEREGGVEDFQNLIKIAHDYGTEVGVHVNAQEVYPEAASFNDSMISSTISNGWGWLDQSHVIDKLWDLSSEARWKRFVQFYDRINDTNYYSLKWPTAVADSQGEVTASKEEIKADAESRPDNMDFIYLDVWYQDAWETRNIAKEINSLGWRFSTEFSAQGEYDSTWQHWSTDAVYGGASSKGYNSSIIRFLRNDQRDSQVLNYPSFGGTADNPLLGGYRLYGFEGWGGDSDFNRYIKETFNQNLPTKFLQHYYVTDWENYEDGQSPVGNQEKQITLKNDDGDVVVVTRNEEQRNDDNIERTITLNGVKVLDDVTYLLPWTDDDGSEKLYHWNLDGGQTTWELPSDWSNLANVVMYELSDQGRVNKVSVDVKDGYVTLDANAATAYVLTKGESVKTLKNSFGEKDYVVDPGFNSYPVGAQLSSNVWSGDIANKAVVVEKAKTGDQRLAFNSPAEDVAVTTTISGLKAGTNYVAEVYVENNSDSKATITVNNGDQSVSNYTERSILNNYVSSDQKNRTKMQRMQISFTATKEIAEITLSRAAGEGSTYMDDIRIVEKTLNNFQEDGIFKQDFESVVQGLYPFVLSSAQGVTDPVTHLSQLHAPYTQAGWNNRVIDDVIDGTWSLKHHGANTGIIYQTIPQNFRFEAGKVYTVEFDYQSGPDKAYAMVIGDGENYTAPTAEQYLAKAHGEAETTHVTMQVIGSGSGQTWIGLYENGSKAGSGSMGQTDFTLDNLVITEDKDAVAVTLSNTSLYKGETSTIYGSGLDQFTWNSSDNSVAVVDKEANLVKAVGAGNTTLTATLADGTETVFNITVTDSVVVDIPRSEYPDITSTANTEETEGESDGSGFAAAVTDGDSSTFWHSEWSGEMFQASIEKPAILLVDFGKEISIGGFKFQQRPSGINGIVKQFRYEILDAAGNTLATSQTMTVAEANQKGGAWNTVLLDNVVKAKSIRMYVEEGGNGFVSLAELEPVFIQKVADAVTLDNVTLTVGDKVTVEPKHANNTILKGLVWSSLDESIVKVNKNGTLTGVKVGTAKISVTNAAGLYAEGTVYVRENLNLTALTQAITNASKINLSGYINGTAKDAFVKALSTAKEVFKTGLTQAEVNAAVTTLTNAQKALKPVFVLDKTTKSNIKVTSSATLYVGGTTSSDKNITVSLPKKVTDAVKNKIVTVKTTYKSSNTKVATVSSTGKITAKASGTAKITTSIVIGKTTLTYTTNVTVKNATVVFTAKKSSMFVGSKSTFSVTLYGYSAKDLVWKTSKSKITDVATNKGKTKAVVTAKTAGTENVYVMVKNNKGKYVNYTTKVTVKNPTVKFTAKKSTMKVGSKYTFTVKLDGYSAKDLVWKTSKSKITNVSTNKGKLKAVVTANTVGTEYVYVMVKNAKGKYVKYTTKVTVTKK